MGDVTPGALGSARTRNDVENDRVVVEDEPGELVDLFLDGKDGSGDALPLE